MLLVNHVTCFYRGKGARIEDTSCIVLADNLCTHHPEKDVHVYTYLRHYAHCRIVPTAELHSSGNCAHHGIVPITELKILEGKIRFFLQDFFQKKENFPPPPLEPFSYFHYKYSE